MDQHAPYETQSSGVSLDVETPDADRLKAIANLVDRSVADVFAEGVEMLRNHYLPSTKPRAASSGDGAVKRPGRPAKAAS